MKKLIHLISIFFIQLVLFTSAFAAEKINQTIDLAGNKQATWYIPDGQAESWVFLQHGFQRNRGNMDHFATTLMNNGFLVLTMNANVTGGNRSLARNVADDLVDNMPLPPNNYPLPNKLILSGHSAGGLFMTYLGERLVERGYSALTGAVLLDPVDKDNGMGGAMQAMVNNNLNVYSILANSSSCNSSNNALQPLRNLSSNFVGIKLTNNSKHTDAEGDSTGGIITWICGSPKDYNVSYLQDFALNWTIDMTAGTMNSDYYPGGSKLQALIDSGDAELIKEINTPPPPIADFTFSVNDLTVQFSDASNDPDGDIVDYHWDFGDGNGSSQANPNHTYLAAGTYIVSLTVTDNEGQIASINKAVTVVDASSTPTANFTFSSHDHVISFTDTSTDSDGTIVEWLWEFGDGETSTESNPVHEYELSGTYVVKLTVTDNDGYTDSTMKEVRISPMGDCTPVQGCLYNGVVEGEISANTGESIHYYMDVPTNASDLEFTISDGSGDADIYVRFNAAPTTSQYDYRPYLSGNDEVVSIDSPQSGRWYVMIRAYSAFSGVTLTANYIDPAKNQAPVADFTSSINGLSVSFTDQSSDIDGTVSARLWTFGDGGESTSENPTYVYQQAGNYTVTLAVTDDDGATDLISKTIAVSDGGAIPLQSGQPVEGLSGTRGSEKHYRLSVPQNTINLEFKISGGTGDADIYVRYGSKPTRSQYDYRPYLSGNNETVTIPGPQTGDWYVMIRAYQSYSDVDLVGTYEDNE